MKPKFITFTGFDDRTNISDIVSISLEFKVEWGILASPTIKDARYPSIQAIQDLCVESSIGLNLSLHCCGSFSKDFQSGRFPKNMLYSMFEYFKRIQLNGKILTATNSIFESHRDKYCCDIIRQCRSFHENHMPLLQLFDLSGGNGRVPEKFPKHQQLPA